MAILRTARAIVSVFGGLALLSCQSAWPVNPGLLGLDATPENLRAPDALDWASQRVSSPALTLSRRAHFKTQVFPAATANWSVAAVAGQPLTAFGAGAGDIASAGPAAAFRTNPADPLYNKLFFLTKAGRFIKVDKANPAVNTPLALPGGKTFSRTFVTLSPNSTRAYLLADDGTCFIVNTLTMTSLATLSVSGGYGIAPFIDPYASRHDGTLDILYLASNGGTVNKYTVSGGTDGSISNISAASSYNVATGVTPLYAGTRKIAAPPVVLNGVIYQGDMGGSLQVYDTANPANNYTYGVGAPVVTAPALEIQDGTYALTDAGGAAKAVPVGAPIYAFVNAGAGCAWVDLHSTLTTTSQSLRIDDNDSAVRFGKLLNYNHSTAGTTEYLAAQDGGNINTETPDRALPAYEPNIWSNDFLVPAETNTYESALATAAGGPIVSYLRWTSAASYGAGSLITSASLSLRPAADQACRVPEIRDTSAMYRDGTGPWTSNALTNGNRPLLGAGNAGAYVSGGVTAAGNVDYRNNKSYLWDVTSNYTTPSVDGRYALALNYNAGGDAVLWPEGPVGGAAGKRARKAYQVEAVKFRNNALNGNPAPGTAGDTRPLLSLVVSNTVLPSASIETAPVIDAVNKRVYVFYTNAMYSLDFSSPAAFSDTDVNLATGVRTPHTAFNMAYHGITANNASGVGGIRPGGAYNNRTKFVGNYTAPVLSYDGSAAYVLSRTPTTDGAAPTAWSYSVSKLSLPFTGAADALVSSTLSVTGVPGQNAPTGGAGEKEASAYMLIDPFATTASGGNVYLGLGNGRLYQFDR